MSNTLYNNAKKFLKYSPVIAATILSSIALQAKAATLRATSDWEEEPGGYVDQFFYTIPGDEKTYMATQTGPNGNPYLDSNYKYPGYFDMKYLKALNITDLSFGRFGGGSGTLKIKLGSADQLDINDIETLIPLRGSLLISGGQINIKNEVGNIWDFHIGYEAQSEITINNLYKAESTFLRNDSTLTINTINGVVFDLRRINHDNYTFVEGGKIVIKGAGGVVFQELGNPGDYTDSANPIDYSLTLIDIGNTGATTFKDKVYAKRILLSAQNSNLFFENGAELYGAIDPAKNSKSSITLKGNGRLGVVGDLSDAKKQPEVLRFIEHNDNQAIRSLNGNIRARQVDFDAGIFRIDQDVIIMSEKIKIDGSAFKVGGNSLIFDGENKKINISGDIEFDIDAQGSVVFQNATLDIAPNSTVNGANLDKITFNNVNNYIAFQGAYSKQLLQKPQQVQDPVVQAQEQAPVQAQESVAQAQAPVAPAPAPEPVAQAPVAPAPVASEQAQAPVQAQESVVQPQEQAPAPVVQPQEQAQESVVQPQEQAPAPVVQAQESVASEQAQALVVQAPVQAPVQAQEQAPVQAQEQAPVQAQESVAQAQVEQGLVQKQAQEPVVVAQESRPSYQPSMSQPATFKQEISRIVQIAPRQNKATVAQVLLDIVDNSNVMDAKQAEKFEQLFSDATIEQKIILTNQISGADSESSLQYQDNATRQASDTVSQAINVRSNFLTDQLILPNASLEQGGNSSGVAPAAGQQDEYSAQNGLWISAFTGSSQHKQSFKTTTSFSGSSIGYERFFDDNKALGFALTVLHSNSKLGARAKLGSNNFIASVYGVNTLGKAVLSGALFAGTGTSKTQRTTTVKSAILNNEGEFKSKIYGAKGTIGYQIQNAQHVFTPTLGLQYVATWQGKYRETGAESIARNMGEKNSQLLTGDLSARYSYVIIQSDMLIIPSLQIGITKDLSMRASDIKLKFAWQDNAYNFKAENKKQTRFFASPNISFKNDMFEILLACTLDKAKKNTGQYFSVKLMSKF